MSLITPDTKKKKIALPSVLSNIRNAVGRAGVEENGKSEVEIRPLLGGTGVLTNRSSGDLVGMGKASGYATDSRSQMRDRSSMPSSGILPPPLSAASSSSVFGGPSSRQTLPPRNAPSTSSSVNNWSATLQTYSERIGSQWRKRNRRDPNNDRRRRRGVTINTQPILIVLGLFFIGVPILLTLFLLARKAVFGDEGVDNVAKHEVPAHEVLFNGLDAGASQSEIGNITSVQVLNGLKELTSEDIALGSVENEVEINRMEGGTDNEAVANNQLEDARAITKEATINEEMTNEVAGESETQTSNLRGSKGKDVISPDVDQFGPPALMNDGGVIDSVGNEGEKISAPIFPSPDEKMNVESSVEKENTNGVPLLHEQINEGSGAVKGNVMAEEGPNDQQ